jgi:hypothetical protein
MGGNQSGDPVLDIGWFPTVGQQGQSQASLGFYPKICHGADKIRCKRMKNLPIQENAQRLEKIRSRLEKSNVVDMSFSGLGPGCGDKQLGYMESVLNVLDENQAWLDENARKKAAKYQ